MAKGCFWARLLVRTSLRRPRSYDRWPSSWERGDGSLALLSPSTGSGSPWWWTVFVHLASSWLRIVTLWVSLPKDSSTDWTAMGAESSNGPLLCTGSMNVLPCGEASIIRSTRDPLMRSQQRVMRVLNGRLRRTDERRASVKPSQRTVPTRSPSQESGGAVLEATKVNVSRARSEKQSS